MGVTHREVARDEHGFMVIFIVMIASVLLGITSLAVDLGLVRSIRRHLQIASDAGALAGAARLQAGDTPSNIRTEATVVASENTGAGAGVVNTSDVGNWSRGAFVADALPRNAVRVQSSDVVPTAFAVIWGVASNRPNVSSVAVVGGADDVNCMIPFAIEDNVLTGRHFGDKLDISRASPGDWGKIDLEGNMSCGPCFENAMIHGVCSRTLSVGDKIPPGTGFAGITNGFEGRIASNPIVTIPIVDGFPNGGSSDVKVVGFIVAELLAKVTKKGAKWTGEIRFIDRTTGNGVSGTVGEPYAVARSLVQ